MKEVQECFFFFFVEYEERQNHLQNQKTKTEYLHDDVCKRVIRGSVL